MPSVHSAEGLKQTSNTGGRAPLTLSGASPIIPATGGVPWSGGFYLVSGNDAVIELYTVPAENPKAIADLVDADYQLQYVFPGGNFEKIRAVKQHATATSVYAVK